MWGTSSPVLQLATVINEQEVEHKKVDVHFSQILYTYNFGIFVSDRKQMHMILLYEWLSMIGGW